MNAARPRIFHGPANVADIGSRLAAWQRAHGAEADFIVYEDASPSRHEHPNLHLEQVPGRWRKALLMLAFFLRCLRRYDLFHFYYGRTLLPLGADLPVLRLFGKKIVMTFCGSDVRRQEIEARRNQYHELIRSGQEAAGNDRRKRRMLRWQGLWVHRFMVVRNTHANVADILPGRKLVREPWVNNVNLDFGAEVPDREPAPVPLVVHAPTNPEVKGTAYVERAVQALRDAGRELRYLRLEGRTRDEVRRILRDEADVVVDQLLVGAFGSLACEGMFYGRAVCCHLVPEILERYPDCPIVPVTVETLEAELGRLLDDPERRRELGARGREFTARHCDPEAINRGVWELYGELLPGGLPAPVPSPERAGR